MVSEQYLTKKELAERLRLHRNAVARLLADGRFPGAFRIGRQWRIPASDLRVFIAGQQNGNGHHANGVASAGGGPGR
jgi:excisionase family DNA binding protein